jgi:hypothetical protein
MTAIYDVQWPSIAHRGRGPWRLIAARQYRAMWRAARSPAAAGKVKTSASHNDYPRYGLRMWDGITASAWLRLLMRNHFAISLGQIPVVLMALAYTPVNSALKCVQNLVFGRRISACALEEPPIFIIGHWRTGTTHLHQLLSLDESFTAPTTLECFAPGYALTFGWLVRKLSFLLPAKRPMDDMPIGWEHPQEDEFALLNLGHGSPYETLIFPNTRQVAHKFLDFSQASAKEVEGWKAGFLSFLQQVCFRSRRERNRSGPARRIVLKSPTHTARIRVLREMFPNAKFIHMVRNPCEVFPSTIRLWRALYATQACQTPDLGELPSGSPSLERYVLETMVLLYRDFFTAVAEIPAENFCQVRYEDLIACPAAELERIYFSLDLGSFDPVRAKLDAHLRAVRGYKPNRHQISSGHKAEVLRRWGWYMKAFGYEASETTSAPHRLDARALRLNSEAPAGQSKKCASDWTSVQASRPPASRVPVFATA